MTWFRHNTDNSKETPIFELGKNKTKVNESGVACIALNATGTVLAAASTKVSPPTYNNNKISSLGHTDKTFRHQIWRQT